MMKRRDFLKAIGIGAAALAAPNIVKATPNKVMTFDEWKISDNHLAKEFSSAQNKPRVFDEYAAKEIKVVANDNLQSMDDGWKAYLNGDEIPLADISDERGIHSPDYMVEGDTLLFKSPFMKMNKP